MDARFSARASAPDAGTMDYYFRIYRSLFSQPPEVSQATVVDSKDSGLFEPEPLLDHCFQQFKRKDFHLPESRRRLIILPQRQEPVPKDPTLPPPPPPPPVPSYKALENGDIQEQPEDTRTWLSRRLKLRTQLEAFGDVRRWLENKPSITPSEAKVLHAIYKELEARSDLASPALRDIRRKSLQVSQKTVPQLRLPRPSALSDLFSYLHKRKLKVLDLFHKADMNGKQRISREEFILTLKAVGAPLSHLEMEDVVIYLDSLGKQNTITLENLANAYKQWSLAQQRSTLYTGRGGYDLNKEKGFPKASLCKQKDTPKMDLLMVPRVDTDTEGWPTTLEEKKEVGKHYQERKRPHKPSVQYSVRSGRGQFAGQCLWSTIPGEMEALFNKARKDALQVYLQCWHLCESYGLPLTEDILMRALLYPGDKIIFQKDYVHPIRQPGGFYSDWKITPKLAQLRDRKESGATRKTFNTKKMRFMDFERFTRKLKKKSPGASLRTHLNSFWPGHLLDKLRLYLPTVARDSSLALFSCVRPEHHVYPAIYHPHRWWPLRDSGYMTCAHYDATKVYYIN